MRSPRPADRRTPAAGGQGGRATTKAGGGVIVVHNPILQGGEAISQNLGWVASPHVRLLSMGAESALFCERTQNIHGLNSSAALLWTLVQAGVSADEVYGAFRGSGAEATLAGIRALIEVWLEQGFVVPHPVLDIMNAEAAETVALRIDDTGVVLKLYGATDVGALEAVFGHLRSDAVGPVVSVVGYGGRDYLSSSGVWLGSCVPYETPARVKAELTSIYVDKPRNGFLLHAALVRAGSRNVLLSGAPGTGKTTLALALTAAGGSYGGDDIVRIDAGLATPVPFAAAVKTGAWSLLADKWPALNGHPIFKRADGQRVRYISPVTSDLRDCSVDAVMLLERRPGASPALEPVSSLETLCALLRSAYSSERDIDGVRLTAFADAIGTARCSKFVYDDLDLAVATLMDAHRG